MGNALAPYDDHKVGHDDVTVPQLTVVLIWLGAFFLYLIRLQKRSFFTLAPKTALPNPKDIERGTKNETPSTNKAEVAISSNNTNNNENNNGKNGENQVVGNTEANGKTATESPEKVAAKVFSAVRARPTLDKFLECVLGLGVLLVYFYLCDYRKIFPGSTKVYNRDTFLFLVFIFLLVVIAFSIRPTADRILGRDQTEEWKGWMQVLFIWYHVFAAKEWYNWIRIYIAAYVWMTGFGNFSFFYVRKDFSVYRVLKMLFRLNFSVVLVSATVSNPIILYYICPMHTYWFLSTYALMATFSSWNEHRYKMMLKFAAYALFNFIIFDVPGVAETIFQPFSLMLGMNDGKHPAMHEWTFRTRLDHWSCFIGMLCAYNYPYVEQFFKWAESASQESYECLRSYGYKIGIGLALGIICAIWYLNVLSLDKYTYNKLHPYTSAIPILSFIYIRNICPLFRRHYVFLLAWLGRTTLETYLAQLHVLMQSNAKETIVYIPGYPLLNFSLATIVYMIISYSLFSITNDASAYLLPSDTGIVKKNILIVSIVIAVCFGAANVVHYGMYVSS